MASEEVRNDIRNDVRSAYDKTKQFVKEHPTATTAVVTTLVGWRLGRNSTMKSVSKQLTRDVGRVLNNYDEALQLNSVWHREGKAVTEAMNDALEFIDMNHMNQEWARFLSGKGKI